MVTTDTLKGGTFNVLYGREHEKVKNEVIALLTKHDLDFLCLEEAVNYVNVMQKIPGYTYIFDGATWSGKESTILVKDTLAIDRVKAFVFGNGWYTIRKKHHPATGQNKCRIDGWCIVRSLHLPTPSIWERGQLTRRTPSNRKDDLIAEMKGLQRFFKMPCVKNARVAAGDWNEPPTTEGLYSPGWLQSTTGAVGKAPVSRLGHGHIDYPIVKGAEILEVFKDTDIAEGSDHEPVIFTVKKISAKEMIKRNLRRKRKN